MGTPIVTDPAKRSRWPIWSLAAVGVIVGALLVASETATAIHADRDHESAYRLIVSVLGIQAHHSDIATIDELLPRMRAWAYGLMAGFAVVGGLLGAAVGWFMCRRTTRCTEAAGSA